VKTSCGRFRSGPLGSRGVQAKQTDMRGSRKKRNAIVFIGSAITAFVIAFSVRGNQRSNLPATNLASAPTARPLQSGSNEAETEVFEPAGSAMARQLIDATADDFPLLLAGTEILPESERNFAIQFILGRWLELDPQRAFEYAAAHKGEYFDVQRFLFQEWASIDPDAALAACLTLPKGYSRDVATTGMLMGAMQLGPNRYMKLLGHLPENAVKNPAGLDEMFATLAASDRIAALEMAAGLPTKYRGRALEGIARVWIKNDPAGAVDWAKSIPGGKTRDRVLGAVLESKWALQHPEDSGPLFKMTSDPRSWYLFDAASMIFRHMKDSDPIAAAEWALDYLPENARGSLMVEQVVEMVHSSSPSRLTALVNLLTGRVVSPEFTESLFNSLGSGHEHALDALTRIPDDTQRASALRGLMSSWTLDKALAALSRLSPADRDEVLPALARAQEPGVEPGVDTATRMNRLVDYVDHHVPPGSVRDKMLSEIVENWVDEDPRGAARLIDAIPELGDSKLVAEVASNWAQYQGAPKDAAHWASSLPEAAQREAAYPAVVRSFAELDRTAASEWLVALPDELAKDKAIGAFVDSVQHQDPATAIEWAQSIQQQETRDVALGKVIDTVAWDDPAAARALVESAPLEATKRQVLLNRIENP